MVAISIVGYHFSPKLKYFVKKLCSFFCSVMHFVKNVFRFLVPYLKFYT